MRFPSATVSRARVARRLPLAANLAANLFAGLIVFAALAFPSRPAAAGWFEGKRYPIVTDATFPADDFILSQAHFWFEIYYHVAEDEGLLHDPFHPELVLRKVKVPSEPGRASSKVIDAVLAQLRSELRAAAAKDEAARTPAEKDLMSRLPSHWDTTHVQLCAERLRFQRGLKNKFRAGVERSYRYLPLIDSVFSERGLPNRLKYLPHVESSFYPHAYSKVGAAGMWQFMKSSARRFKMKVGYHVDERRDPIASTSAAADMLAYNRNYLQSWPLALVAYNHGPGGLAKAARVTGTRDLTTIIKSYYSNSFGFASKNFYAEFLAASSIALRADSLYPGLAKMEPLRFQRLALPKAVGTRLLCSLTGLSAAELEEYNLGLRPATFRADAQLPKGHVINLPVSLDLARVASRLGAGTAAVAALASAKPEAAAPGAAPSGPAGASSPSDSAALAAAPAAVDKVEAAPASAAAAMNAVAQAAAADAGNAPAPAARDRKPARERVAAAGQPAQREAARDPETGKPVAGKSGSAADARSPALASSQAGKGKAAHELRPAGPSPADVKAPAGRDAAPKAEIPLEVAVATAPVQGAGAAAERVSPQSAALPVPARPAVPAPSGAAAAGPSAGPGGESGVVDSTFALQVAGVDKLAHPMDRFNPAIYNLGYAYEKGVLTIQAGTEETLSHYAEWAWIPEQTLKRLNRIRSPRDIRMGRSIKIPVAEEKAGEFVKKREEYYRAMEEDFYSNYYVSAVEPLVVLKGMNLWGLINEKEIPFWLLQKHNPGKTLGAVRPGDTLSLPLIETGIRKWGFTRYGNSREYLAGITRHILSTDSAQ